MFLFGNRNGTGRERLNRPRSGKERALGSLVSLFVGILIACVLFLVPLPYFIYMPGTAEEVKPMVKVEAADADEKGVLMLTTVYAKKASVATYLVALVHPYEEVAPQSTAFQPGESQNEYMHRQEYVMLTSQSSAIQAAYNRAGVPYRITADGVMVLRFVAGLPAEKVLKSGDIIMEVDGTKVEKTADLQKQLQGKKPGDTVKLTFTRNGETLHTDLALSELKDETAQQGAAPRIGLGILNPADVQSIRAEQPAKQVVISAGEIGGPSAGLMFALEIYNQLVPEDITKGYRIAGTGTIDSEGHIGAIGGIQHKIIAADREKADIFFAPKDYQTESGYWYRNYSEARARADQIGTSMKVVPVGTMDEALAYLASLPEK